MRGGSRPFPVGGEESDRDQERLHEGLDRAWLGRRTGPGLPEGQSRGRRALVGMKADVTAILRQWSDGDQAAAAQLAPLVYAELRRVAHRYLRHERPNHTLHSAELVHEAYLRLVDLKQARWQDRAHFFAVSGQIMRRILVDHARARLREKRGAGA